MVAVIDRWSLFGGGRLLRFDCTRNAIMSFILMLKARIRKERVQSFEAYYCNKRVIFLIYTLILICMLNISHAQYVHMYLT